ncbi:MAG: GWxTD domain-containing protein [Ignavibacteriaceae bacterium]|nr:GWxTD domain-containing protein [Ignavibacteriaceae bacterium]
MKILSTFRVILFFLLISCYSIKAQNLFDFDYAQFGYDSVSNYIEFYYSFNQSMLNPFDSDSLKVVSGILQITIEDTSSGQKIIDKEWRVSHPASKSVEEASKYLIGVVGFLVPHGNYRCSIGGRDATNEQSKKNYSEFISSTHFITSHISISDIQLASRIVQDSPNKESIFYKNSMEIYPIPTSVFGENQPVVFYYSELYNLLPSNGSSSLKIISSVYNSRGKQVFSKSKPISRVYDSRVEVGSIVVNKFPTDTYTFVIALIDSGSNYGVSSTKKFYVFNPSVIADDSATSQVSGVFASEFGVMTDEELDEHFAKSKYVATEEELEKFEKIASTEGKREFLYNFWKDRDNDLSTTENEFYKNYFKRVALSNQRYGSISRVGWKSDRGRVFILYGEPSEIERYPNQVDSKPYEIWYYNELEGGVVFVFADLTGFSDYTLLHSTLRGELRDDNWSRRISTF